MQHQHDMKKVTKVTFRRITPLRARAYTCKSVAASLSSPFVTEALPAKYSGSPRARLWRLIEPSAATQTRLPFAKPTAPLLPMPSARNTHQRLAQPIFAHAAVRRLAEPSRTRAGRTDDQTLAKIQSSRKRLRCRVRNNFFIAAYSKIYFAIEGRSNGERRFWFAHRRWATQPRANSVPSRDKKISRAQ